MINSKLNYTIHRAENGGYAVTLRRDYDCTSAFLKAGTLDDVFTYIASQLDPLDKADEEALKATDEEALWLDAIQPAPEHERAGSG